MIFLAPGVLPGEIRHNEKMDGLYLTVAHFTMAGAAYA